MRTFQTGATRDSDETKPDLDGFLSSPVMLSYARYMNKHRIQADGGVRASDNWKSGIPMDAYIKSAWRHWFDVWSIHHGHPTISGSIDIEEELNALLFNIMGYLHEHLKEQDEHAFSYGPIPYDVTPDASPNDPFYHIWLELEQSREHGA